MPEVMLEVNKFTEDIITESVLIDRGGQGKVYTRHHITHGDIAIKMFSAKKLSNSEKKEINNLIQFNSNRFIIRFLGVVVNVRGECVGHVTEYMDGGSLAKVIHDNTTYLKRHAYWWIEQAACGLAFLHEKNIVHRDVKPANMLLSDTRTNLKICDLGLSRHFDAITSWGGTSLYMAPEAISSVETATFPSDVWSFGVSIWELLNRRYPYSDNGFMSSFRMQTLVKNGDLAPIWTKKHDKESDGLLSRMCRFDPKERPKIMEIREFAAKMKETCPLKGRWAYVTKDLNSQMENLSVSDPSTSGCSSSSLEAPKTKKLVDCLKPWQETSKSLAAMSDKNAQLKSMSTKIDESAGEIKNLNRKQSEAGVMKCINYVKCRLIEVIEYINGSEPKFDPKDKDAKALFARLKAQTSEISELFELEAQKKLFSTSQKSATKLI